jgi:tryptophan synthase alpha chain
MSRIAKRFENLRDRNEKALALFVTAGFPEHDSTPGLASLFEEGGCDLIELGMPFSDPLADGPAIQVSSARALANGVTLDSILEDVRSIREQSDIPLVLMGYLNPILRFGEKRFFAAAAASGVDGIILPEVPLEEFDRFSTLLNENTLEGILLVTPATPVRRIQAIDAASSGFLYCVSTTGVTGTRVGGDPAAYLQKVKSHAHKNPLMVGFGISTPADARTYATVSDGIIVGSALIRFLATSPTDEGIRAWVRGFKDALAER